MDKRRERMNKLRLCVQRVVTYSGHFMHWGIQLEPTRVQGEIPVLKAALGASGWHSH